MLTAFDSRVARPTRFSPRGESAVGPWSTCALADLALLSSRPTCDALHQVPLAEALLHRHCARSTAAASQRSWSPHATPVVRGDRALRTWRTVRRPTEHARAGDVTWLSSWPMRDALHPTPLAEALLHRHRARLAAAASKRRNHRVQSPWCARARASPRGEPADGPRNTRALADLAWLSLRPTRVALYTTPLTEALLYRHCARSAAALRNVVVAAFNPRAARRARASPRGE